MAEAGYGPIGGIAEEATGTEEALRHGAFVWSVLGGLKADVAEKGELAGGDEDDEVPVGETFMLASLYCLW